MSHRDVSSVARVHMFTLGIKSQPHQVLAQLQPRNRKRIKEHPHGVMLGHYAPRPQRTSSENSGCFHPYIIDKHAEMEVGYGAERSTRDKDDGLLIWMALKKIEAVVRKRIAWRRGEARGQTSNVLLRRCGHGGRRYGEI